MKILGFNEKDEIITLAQDVEMPKETPAIVDITFDHRGESIQRKNAVIYNIINHQSGEISFTLTDIFNTDHFEKVEFSKIQLLKTRIDKTNFEKRFKIKDNKLNSR